MVFDKFENNFNYENLLSFIGFYYIRSYNFRSFIYNLNEKNQLKDHIHP